MDGKAPGDGRSPGEVRLSPQVRTDPLSQAVRAIPYDDADELRRSSEPADGRQVNRGTVYVVGFRGGHIVGAGVSEFYATGLDNATPGTGKYSVVHPDVDSVTRTTAIGSVHVGVYAGTGRVISTTESRRDGATTHLTTVENGREIAGRQAVPCIRSSATTSCRAQREPN